MTVLMGSTAGALIAAGIALLVLGLAGFFHREAGSPPSRLQRWRRDSSRSRSRTRLVELGAALVAGVLALVFTGWVVAGLAAFLAVVFVPQMFSSKDARRQLDRLVAMEEWTRRLADVLSASRGLEDALVQSQRTTPAPIRADVDALVARLYARQDTEAALRAFADDLNDSTGDRIVGALILAARARSRGVPDVLRALAASVAEEVTLRRGVETARMAPKTEARWLVILLIIFIALASVLARGWLAPYGTPIGQLVLAVIFGMFALGLVMLKRMSRVKPSPRFLPADNREATTA